MKIILLAILVTFLLSACNYKPVKEHNEQIKKEVEQGKQQKTPSQ
ncbi:hypothetical protein ACFPYJ_02240 [Paenibacillus solisilvae]|uniref:Lipoprotein n=1 Tax=Paenibacillus solisilvae TaxID=2486751 RepID=A0ABW0VSU4_9BACL